MELTLPDYHREDHRQHAVAGMAVGGLSLALVDAYAPNATRTVRIVVPVLAAVAVGFVKEVGDATDPRHHTAETGDLLATAAGGAVLSVCLSIKF